MIFDTDDLYEGHDRLDLLYELKKANPAFRMTAFCVTGRCSEQYLETLPDWIECVPHGWLHPTPVEAAQWSYEETMEVLLSAPGRMVEGWKSPGWQISDGTYQALLELDWWVADQHYNDERRPLGLRYHCEGDGDHVHTHVQNVCGTGLEETFDLISEVVRPW
jgi:hypothetical protein